MVKSIHQTINFDNVKPHEVYELLMDEKKHLGFTREKSSISRKVGGKISAYGRWIEGENIELVKDSKIVQKWRGADWPEGHFSTAKFEFKLASDKKSTILDFTQSGVPDEQVKHISKGWHEHYWDRMKEYLK